MSSLENIGDRDFDDPIFVTGLARSGTSLTASMFCESGFWSGTVSEYSVNNPRGFFENRQLKLATTRRMLNDNKFDPMGQKPIPKANERLVLKFNLRNTVYNIIKEQGYKGGPWMFKDAKMLFSWNHWFDAFPYADWVITKRDTDKVINSCLRTKFMIKRKSVSEWKEWADIHISKINELLFSEANTNVIHTDPLSKKNFTELKKLFEALEIDFDEDKLSAIIVDGAMK